MPSAAQSRRPPPLRPGGRVAVVAPGGSASRRPLAAGMEALERAGFEVVPPRRRRPDGFLAASDAERAEDLVDALTGPRVDAVFAARGGGGTARLLPSIAKALADAPPRVFVGYSDLTSLLVHLTDHLGWAAFHGPMVAPDLARLRPAEWRSLRRAVGGEIPDALAVPRALHAGGARGRLTGGCLSILTSLLGTPWAPKSRGRILFIEEVSEPLYRIDRMMTHLAQAGGFEGVRGVVFGEFPGCGPRRPLLRLLARATEHLAVPVAFGLPSGHGPGHRTLPLGVVATLDTDARRLSFDAPATR